MRLCRASDSHADATVPITIGTHASQEATIFIQNR